jgi:hypothetical protein
VTSRGMIPAVLAPPMATVLALLALRLLDVSRDTKFAILVVVVVVSTTASAAVLLTLRGRSSRQP